MDHPLPGLMNNTPPPADAQVLWRHFSETYFSLRLGLAVLAFAFPAVLYFWGLSQNIHHTNADAGYTTAGALPQGPQSVSPLLLRGSPYKGLEAILPTPRLALTVAPPSCTSEQLALPQREAQAAQAQRQLPPPQTPYLDQQGTTVQR